MPPMLSGTQDGFTHAFSIIFENEEDRDYYIEQDKAHLDFAQSLRTVAEKAIVVDYEPNVL